MLTENINKSIHTAGMISINIFFTVIFFTAHAFSTNEEVFFIFINKYYTHVFLMIHLLTE